MFGEKLAKLRKNKKITQEELANLLNMSDSAIAMYEKNKREPDFSILKKIALVFNVSIDYLLDVELNNKKIDNYPLGRYLYEEEIILLMCFNKASPDDKNVVWAILNKYRIDKENNKSE